jgi:hypothetical protein
MFMEFAGFSRVLTLCAVAANLVDRGHGTAVLRLDIEIDIDGIPL